MNRKLNDLVLTIIFGFISCIIFGLLFYGKNIFNFHDTRFQIVILGFYGSVVYSVMKYRKPSALIYTAVILLLIGFVIRGKTVSLYYFFMDVLLLGSVFVSVYLYKIFIDKNKTLPIFLRSVLLMILFGVWNIVAVVILTYIYHPDAKIFSWSLLFYSKIPALTGLALGIGFDIYSKYGVKLSSRLIK